jgi:hypothetical protein
MMRKSALTFFLAVLLAGCGKPVPPEKSAYVGEWQSPQMAIHITQDGSVAYKRLKAGLTTSINAPLKGFVGNNFTVGVGPMETTFEVSSTPHQADGVWKMTIDGVELHKVQ